MEDVFLAEKVFDNDSGWISDKKRNNCLKNGASRSGQSILDVCDGS